MEYKVEYTPTEQDLKNLQTIKDFLEETNIPYIEDNEIFGLIHINDKTIQLRYINSFYHKIDLSHRFGDICKGIPKRYFIDISHENARNNIRTIWIFDFEMSQTNETPITLPHGEVIEHFHRQWEVIKNTIRTATGHINNRFYARDCEIREIDNTTLRKFLETNCFYGYRSANLNLGMFLKKDKNGFKAGTLLMVYTFGYNYYGNRGREDDPFIEIIRVSTLLGCQVIGGASKFLTHFFNNYPVLYIGGKETPVRELRFYVDASHNNGMAMRAMGFDPISWSDEGFMNCWAKDYEDENGLPLKGKAGEIFQRKPKYHKEIMKLIGEGIIYSVENAGTAVYSTTKDKFLEFMKADKKDYPKLLCEDTSFFEKPKKPKTPKVRKKKEKEANKEKELSVVEVITEVETDKEKINDFINSLVMEVPSKGTSESENKTNKKEDFKIKVGTQQPDEITNVVDSTKENKKDKKVNKSKEREKLSTNLTNMLSNLSTLLNIQGIDNDKLGGLIDTINKQAETIKAQGN